MVLCQRLFLSSCCLGDAPASCPPRRWWGTGTWVLPAGTPGQHPPCHPAKQQAWPAAAGVTPPLRASGVYPCWLWIQAAPWKIFTCKEEPGVSELWHRLLKSALSIYFGGIFPISGFPAGWDRGGGGCTPPRDTSLVAALWEESGPVTRSRDIWGCQLPGMEDGHSQHVGAEPCNRPRGPELAAQPWGLNDAGKCLAWHS